MRTAARLDADCLPVRTEEGTRRMVARDADLSAKLRASLLLVTGRQTLGELLQLVGGIAHVLEEQIHILLELGLVEIADGPRTASAPAVDIGVAAARIQLLGRLESTGCAERGVVTQRIREAGTLAELVERAREAAICVQQAMGRPAAQAFWSHARGILLHWQGRAAGGARLRGGRVGHA